MRSYVAFVMCAWQLIRHELPGVLIFFIRAGCHNRLSHTKGKLWQSFQNHHSHALQWKLHLAYRLSLYTNCIGERPHCERRDVLHIGL